MKFSISLLGASLLFGGSLVNGYAQSITLEDFQKGTYRTRPSNVYEFTPDGNDLLKMSTLEEDANTYWFITTVKPTQKFQTGDTLFHSKWFKDSVPMGKYTLSENRDFLLIETNHTAIYRHSFTVNAYVADLKKRTLKEIPGTLRYPTLSPDNTKVAYVRDNNLFIYDLSKNWETQITQDGQHNALINGAVDWVYEEEFSMSQGFEWSPSGRFIAFYKFDESQVKEFSMDAFYDLYPNQVKWKYPKAGEDNSRVDVYVYDTRAKNLTQLPLLSHQDQYIPRFQWLHNDQFLSVQRLNRWQNHWEVLLWNTQEQKLYEILEEGSETYIDINDKFHLVPNTTEFLYLSDISGYRHIYRCNYMKKKVEAVTEGNWQVNDIHAIHPKSQTIYYSSTETSTVEDHLYSIQLNGTKKRSVLGNKPLTGNQRVICSKYGQWIYILNSAMTGTPNFKTHLMGQNVNWVQEDTLFRNKIQGATYSRVTFHELPLASDPNTTLNYFMIKPAQFDPNKKYPLLMYCYGGPGNSSARNSINGYWAWYQYLASQGYIIACVDNRGTGNKGEAFKKATYLNLGKLEQEDQRFAAEYFGSLPYIDKNRIGIWGWSFGGYLTSLCMVKSPDIFKMGIAVAPVTHWKYYDNIYTERYLRRPIDNPQGYEDNSPINFAHQLKGKYLIVHGTGDDNVHFQNSAEMINALIKAGKPFDSEIYPNRAHGISDRAANHHLFQKISRFILENL
jgi:dipeptidyl-peptidase 4